MEKKLIFLDIDGTLTEPGSNVPPQSALEAIRQAQEKGNLVFLCSGRNYDMLSALLRYRFDGAVASSGGYVICQGKVIYDHPMTEEQGRAAMEVFRKNGVFITVECLDGSYTDEGFKEFLQERAAEGGNSELLRWRRQIEKELNILPLGEYRGQRIYKIVFMCQDLKQLEEPRRLFGNAFSFCIQSMDQYGIINGEFISKEFDKGRGIREVCSYLKVPVEHTVAFGDSMNDLEMMETAGLSVCMANGSEVLKQKADAVCPAVAEDGLAKAFRKYALC